MKFTDLLDEYLDQKTRVKNLQEGFSGYGFNNVFYQKVADLDKAKAALNDAFEKGLA